MVQHVSAVLRHIKIGKTVVVVVTPNATEAVACAGNTRCFGNIGECAVSIVAIKRVARRNAAIIEIASIDEVNVRKAIGVKIRDANARTKYFSIDGDSVVPSEVRELDSGWSGYIREL